MPAEQPSLAVAADDYSKTLLRELGDPPRLDLAVLGIGPDGHVASLFPNHPPSGDSRWVRAVADSPKPPARRLTLTYAALAQAGTLVFAALGADKGPIVSAVLEAADKTLPAVRALTRAKRSVFVLDEAAASVARARGLIEPS
jgi:6-phosphogluconolactonase